MLNTNWIRGLHLLRDEVLEQESVDLSLFLLLGLLGVLLPKLLELCLIPPSWVLEVLTLINDFNSDFQEFLRSNSMGQPYRSLSTSCLAFLLGCLVLGFFLLGCFLRLQEEDGVGE